MITNDYFKIQKLVLETQSPQKAQRSLIDIYCDIMKTSQYAHPPHHHNGFVATCWLWTTSGVFHKLSVLEPTVPVGKYVYQNRN